MRGLGPAIPVEKPGAAARAGGSLTVTEDESWRLGRSQLLAVSSIRISPAFDRRLNSPSPIKGQALGERDYEGVTKIFGRLGG